MTPVSASKFMLPYWNPYREDGSYTSVGDGSWNGTNQNPLEWLDNNLKSDFGEEMRQASRLFEKHPELHAVLNRSE